MNPRDRTQSTDPSLVPSSRAYIVYDRTSGEILHIHHAVDFGNAAAVREQPEARARRLAGTKAGPHADIIIVNSDEVNHREPKRVDVATGKVVRG